MRSKSNEVDYNNCIICWCRISFKQVCHYFTPGFVESLDNQITSNQRPVKCIKSIAVSYNFPTF